MEKNEIVFAIPMLITLCILIMVFINIVSISIILPANNAVITERRPTFLWSGLQGEYIFYLDEDPFFKTPITAKVKGNNYTPEKDLDLGIYYWKVESKPFSSEVAKFNLVSSIILSRKENEIKNEGNTPLLIRSSGYTGAFVLGINETMKIGREENVFAEQK
ncbi:MAG: hypothetical protein QW051_02505 [Candidatus Aenigmatarchaeota archaeon]